MENVNQVVSRNLIKLRLLAGLTQKELAKKINYSDKSISKWESGDKLPDIAVLVKLSEIYNVEITAFLNENTKEQEIEVSNKYINKKHILSSMMSAGVVWFIATIVFVVLEMIEAIEQYAWLSFMYAIPVSSIVLLVLSKCWWKNYYLNLAFSSIILWGAIVAVCLTVSNEKIWSLCYVGIVVQILTLIWYIFRDKLVKIYKNVKKQSK